MKTHFKRLISGLLSTVMITSIIPFTPVHAEESTASYPYTLFAASSDEGAITINTANFCLNGNVATNGTIISNGNINVNGTKTENAEESMIYVFDKIDTQFFSSSNVEEYEEDFVLEETNISINLPTSVHGEAILTGNININNSLKALEDISLFGEVKNSNDSTIFAKYGNIIIDSQNVNLNGLIYAPFGTVDITAQNLNLNNVVIIADSIIINCPNANINHNRSVADFVGVTSETLIPDVNIDTTDTDCDGIPDYFENSYETDLNNPDTDGDGLPDGYEVFIIGTNPTKVDSDDNGIWDSDEDLDDDGLINIEELTFGTYPDIPDSDLDGLSDYDEINNYHTNPLLFDTDEDGINDGDEISMGLNPLDPQTKGVPDSQAVVKQNLNQESVPFMYINVEDSPYKLSAEIDCSGLASNALTVEPSAKGSSLNGDFYIGDIIDVKFSEDQNIENVLLNFEIDDNLLNSEYEGFEDLHRFSVFRYFKELGMIFPVESLESSESNTITTTVTESGTFCLVDLPLWLNDCGISLDDDLSELEFFPKGEEIDTLSNPESSNISNSLLNIPNINILSNSPSSSNTTTPKTYSTYCDPVDVVFLVNCAANNSDEYFEEVKAQILKTGEELFDLSISAQISIICYTNNVSGIPYCVHLTSLFNDNEYATSYLQLYTMVNKIERNEMVEDSLLEAGLMDVAYPIYIGHQYKPRENVPVFCYQFLGCGTPGTYLFHYYTDLDTYFGNYHFLFNHMKNRGIMYSALIDNPSNTAVTNFLLPYAWEMNGFVDCFNNPTLKDTIIEHILEFVDTHTYSTSRTNGNTTPYKPRPPRKYCAFVLDGLKELTLDEPITRDYIMASRNYSEENHSDFNLFADTDTDGLYDFLEIKIDDGLIYFDENDIAVLPTFNDCKYYLEDEYFYVSSGYSRMCDEFNSHHDHYTLEYILGIVPVLPLNSDPTLEDSDADLLSDKIDNEPLVEIGDVSKCWLYKNGYDEIYKVLYGANDYYHYDDHDVNNHRLELKPEIDDNGDEILYYVCTEECCNDHSGYDQVKFLSPSYEDDIMCGDDGKYSDGKYMLIKQLEIASTTFLTAGNLKYSEALYHIVDQYREQNEVDWSSTQGFKYQYSSNGHYVSPMKYTYSEDELDVAVDLGIGYKNIAVEQLKLILINHTYAIFFGYAGIQATTLLQGSICYFGGLGVGELCSRSDSYFCEEHNVVSDTCSKIDKASFTSFISSLVTKKLANSNIFPNTTSKFSKHSSTRSAVLAKASIGLNTFLLVKDLESWADRWENDSYYNCFSVGITIESSSSYEGIISSKYLISNRFCDPYIYGDDRDNKIKILDDERLRNPDRKNTYTVSAYDTEVYWLDKSYSTPIYSGS